MTFDEIDVDVIELQPEVGSSATRDRWGYQFT